MSGATCPISYASFLCLRLCTLCSLKGQHSREDLLSVNSATSLHQSKSSINGQYRASEGKCLNFSNVYLQALGLINTSLSKKRFYIRDYDNKLFNVLVENAAEIQAVYQNVDSRGLDHSSLFVWGGFCHCHN